MAITVSLYQYLMADNEDRVTLKKSMDLNMIRRGNRVLSHVSGECHVPY